MPAALEVPLAAEVGGRAAEDFLDALPAAHRALVCRAISSAATPLTCGAAMLVPSFTPVDLFPAPAPRSSRPGATRSGFAPAIACRAAAGEVAHAVGVRLDAWVAPTVMTASALPGSVMLIAPWLSGAPAAVDYCLVSLVAGRDDHDRPRRPAARTPRRSACVRTRSSRHRAASDRLRFTPWIGHVGRECSVEHSERTARAAMTVNSSPRPCVQDSQVVEPDAGANADALLVRRRLLLLAPRMPATCVP